MIKLRRVILLSVLMGCVISASAGTKTVMISMGTTYQTIEGFGASDGWSAQCVGDWTTNTKEPIAKLLFSKDKDPLGNPLGIGLSRWRFNIGAGSAYQGDDSNISDPSRRTECFLKDDGTYDWTQQAGERWFLEQAKNYGVEKLVAWINSPPIYYTQTGRANTDNTGNYGSSNLQEDKYDDFALFAATVLDHFKQDEGIDFQYLSPVNEPQYTWSEGQEGTPWRNVEIARLVREINTALVSKNLLTEIFVAEAGSYKYTYGVNGSADHSDQMDDFFDNTSANYIGNLSNVAQGLSTHSYWVNSTNASMKTARQSARSKADKYGLKIYQTEYSMLSLPDESHFPINSKFDRALFLAKLIHYDMTVSNCVSWSYWTAIDRERWNHENRFYLIKVVPDNGVYQDFTQSTSGTHTADKNLWVLGNFSRFLRPGYQRLGTLGFVDSEDFMGSVYLAPDSSELVSVYINTTIIPQEVEQKFNLPEGMVADKTELYVTDATRNLKFMGSELPSATFSLPSRSVTTMVTSLSKTTGVKQLLNPEKVICFPNPAKDLLNIQLSSKEEAFIRITTLSGQEVLSRYIINSSSVDLSDFSAGVYILSVNNCNFTKILVQ